jgi:hydrogenase-4 membrane subunit HyfE
VERQLVELLIVQRPAINIIAKLLVPYRLTYAVKHSRVRQDESSLFTPSRGRFANLYFLFIVLLNWILVLSAFGKELAMIVNIFVLAVTAIKDTFTFEEHRRRQVKKNISGHFAVFP